MIYLLLVCIKGTIYIYMYIIDKYLSLSIYRGIIIIITQVIINIYDYICIHVCTQI